jgi:hypothetical protein
MKPIAVTTGFTALVLVDLGDRLPLSTMSDDTARKEIWFGDNSFLACTVIIALQSCSNVAIGRTKIPVHLMAR